MTMKGGRHNSTCTLEGLPMGEGSYTLQNRRAALRQVWLSHVQLFTKQYAQAIRRFGISVNN